MQSTVRPDMLLSVFGTVHWQKSPYPTLKSSSALTARPANSSRGLAPSYLVSDIWKLYRETQNNTSIAIPRAVREYGSLYATCARALSLIVRILLSIRATCPPAPEMSTLIPSCFNSFAMLPTPPSPSDIITFTKKFLEARVLIISEIPFLITLAHRLALLVSYDVSETARVRSSGVATPTIDGILSTNITSIASSCSVW